MHQLDLPTAFLAGILSFLSPCVLPLVPGYISMISGATTEELKSGTHPGLAGRIIRNTIAFVIGLSAIYVVLGFFANTVGFFLKSHQLIFNIVAGTIIIILGLHLTGLVKIPILYRQATINTGAPRRGVLGAFVLGLAFASGWTPCIGPILGGILLLASTKGNGLVAMFLLAVFSAGLGIPFLLTGLGFSQFLKFYGKFRKHLQVVEVVSGVMLIGIGVIIALNKVTTLSGYLSFLNRFTL